MTNQLLASLPADDLQRLRPHRRTVKLKPKQVLHKQGDSVYFGPEESFTQSVVQVPGQSADVLTVEAFNAEMARKGSSSSASCDTSRR